MFTLLILAATRARKWVGNWKSHSLRKSVESIESEYHKSLGDWYGPTPGHPHFWGGP